MLPECHMCGVKAWPLATFLETHYTRRTHRYDVTIVKACKACAGKLRAATDRTHLEVSLQFLP